MKNTPPSEKDLLFFCAVTHTLIGFYISLEYAKVHTSLSEKNALLIKSLKNLLSLKKYKPVKNDIKSLIHFGRNSRSNLEAKMREIHSLSETYLVSVSSDSDIARLTTLLKRLHDEHDILTELTDIPIIETSNNCYLHKSNIEIAFSDTGYWTQNAELKISTPINYLEKVKQFFESNNWRFHNEKRQSPQMSLLYFVPY